VTYRNSKFLAAATIVLSISMGNTEADELGDSVHDGEMTVGVGSSGGNCNGCEWIQVEGVISSTAGKTFESFLSSHTDGLPSTVTLNSLGGSLSGGLALGRVIRKHGLSTDVKNYRCASACAYAFLGGRSRTAVAGQIGVHQFFDPTSSSSELPKFSEKDLAQIETLQQESFSDLLTYVNEMGVSLNFLVTAGYTKPNQVYYFNDEQLSQFSINLDAEEIGIWNVDVSNGRLVLAGSSDNRKYSMTFYCKNSHSDIFVEVAYNNLDSVTIAQMKEAAAEVFWFSAYDPSAKTARRARSSNSTMRSKSGNVYVDSSVSLADLIKVIDIGTTVDFGLDNYANVPRYILDGLYVRTAMGATVAAKLNAMYEQCSR
jgi:hypothetical protein